MQELNKLDKVAYVRFASVYKSFEDIGEFVQAIKEMQGPIIGPKSAAGPARPTGTTSPPGTDNPAGTDNPKSTKR